MNRKWTGSELEMNRKWTGSRRGEGCRVVDVSSTEQMFDFFFSLFDLLFLLFWTSPSENVSYFLSTSSGTCGWHVLFWPPVSNWWTCHFLPAARRRRRRYRPYPFPSESSCVERKTPLAVSPSIRPCVLGDSSNKLNKSIEFGELSSVNRRNWVWVFVLIAADGLQFALTEEGGEEQQQQRETKEDRWPKINMGQK